MKSKIRKRREAGAICSKCKSPDYKHEGTTEFGKHQFTCNSCGHGWQYGKTESIYTQLA